jgi:hypothetical protein
VVTRGLGTPVRGFRSSRLRLRGGFGFPLWGGFAPYFYPSEYIAPYSGAPYAYPAIDYVPSPEQTTPVVVLRPGGCRTQSQKVSSETGGESTIDIVRCYPNSYVPLGAPEPETGNEMR